MKNEIALKKIQDAELKYHHSASRRGYASRKNLEGHFEEYDGVFGKGVIHILPRFDTTQYVSITYYLR